MQSSFFVDPDFSTPCSNNGDIKPKGDGTTNYANHQEKCNNVRTKKSAFNDASAVVVDGTEYRYNPHSRKVNSIVVQKGATGSKESSHGTSVAGAINGFVSMDKQFESCPAHVEKQRGVAYSSKISLY